jgi:hypothetical protein
MSFRKVTVVVVALVAASVGVGAAPAASAAPPKPPKWIEHVQRYPGGISNGVRSAVDEGNQSARQGQQGAGEFHVGLNNVKMNDDTTPDKPQNETQVVISLRNPMVAVAASNDYFSGGIWIGRTTDGGRTWSNFRAAPTSSKRELCEGGGDPALAYSRRDQAFYAAQLCFFGTKADSEVQLWKSVDEGATWTPSAKGATVITNVAANGSVDDSVFFDKELVAIDNNPSSDHYGRIYVTYIKFHILPDGFSDYCPVQLAYTDRVPTANPRGASWTHVAVVPDMPEGHGVGAGANQWATPVVDSQGGLDIAYASEDCNTGFDPALLFKRSVNGGASFGPAVHIDRPGEFADNPDLADLLPNKSFRAPISPSLAFNSASGALEYVYQNNVNRLISGADISFQQSWDFGATWTHAKFISVTPTGGPAPHDQFMPWIAADESGNLHAIWFDNRNDPNNHMIQTFQAFSEDDGETWTNFNISSVAWDPDQSFRRSGRFIGDYIGLAASDAVIYPVWTDGRNSPGSPNGVADIYTNVEIRGSAH